jgi:hypothetical protein
MAHQQPAQLSDAEEVVALARIRVQGLADALLREPISRATYTELATYLEGPGWRACDALDVMRSMTTAQIRDRITEVLACTAHPVPAAVRRAS